MSAREVVCRRRSVDVRRRDALIPYGRPRAALAPPQISMSDSHGDFTDKKIPKNKKKKKPWLECDEIEQSMLVEFHEHMQIKCWAKNRDNKQGGTYAEDAIKAFASCVRIGMLGRRCSH